MRIIKYNQMAINYELSKSEMMELWMIALKRQYLKNNNHKCLDKRIKPYPNARMHFIGLLGEYCFEKYTGIPMDRNGYYHGDKKGDFLGKIEIKTYQGYLVFDLENFDNEFIASVVVLAIYKVFNDKILPNVSLQGWTDKQNFIDHRFMDDFGWGSRYCIQPSDLFYMNTIMEKIK